MEIESIEGLSDKELEEQLAAALNWRNKLGPIHAEIMRRIEQKRTYVEIVCPVCEGSGKTGQPPGGDPFDTKCAKCQGTGYIRGYLKE